MSDKSDLELVRRFLPGPELGHVREAFDRLEASLAHLQNGADLYSSYMRLAIQSGHRFSKVDLDWLEAETARKATR